MSATALTGSMRPMGSGERFAEAVGHDEAHSHKETTISETARLYGVTLRTLRFYEDRGLIRPRRAGNARYYGGLERVRIQMILNGKRLGFTLAEIAELIGAPDPAHASGPDFETRLAPQQISSQIDHLERQRGEIDDAIARLRSTHSRLAQAAGG